MGSLGNDAALAALVAAPAQPGGAASVNAPAAALHLAADAHELIPHPLHPASLLDRLELNLRDFRSADHELEAAIERMGNDLAAFTPQLAQLAMTTSRARWEALVAAREDVMETVEFVDGPSTCKCAFFDASPRTFTYSLQSPSRDSLERRVVAQCASCTAWRAALRLKPRVVLGALETLRMSLALIGSSRGLQQNTRPTRR
jgi:hypothetical protein